jgi:hypothetical protein
MFYAALAVSAVGFAVAVGERHAADWLAAFAAAAIAFSIPALVIWLT